MADRGHLSQAPSGGGRRTAGITLRRAVPADAPLVAALVDAAYRGYVSRIGRRPGPMTEDHAEVIGRARVTVAEVGGEIVGLLVLAVDDEGFLIENVAVDPAVAVSGGRSWSSRRSRRGKRGSTRSISTPTS